MVVSAPASTVIKVRTSTKTESIFSQPGAEVNAHNILLEHRGTKRIRNILIVDVIGRRPIESAGSQRAQLERIDAAYQVSFEVNRVGLLSMLTGFVTVSVHPLLFETINETW